MLLWSALKPMSTVDFLFRHFNWLLPNCQHLDPGRRMHLTKWARAHAAHRDARLVWKAASAGRPLELRRRLVLGKLAGGLTRREALVPAGVEDGDGDRDGVLAIDAARARGHAECVEVLSALHRAAMV